jgi:hypothetical protein
MKTRINFEFSKPRLLAKSLDVNVDNYRLCKVVVVSTILCPTSAPYNIGNFLNNENELIFLMDLDKK